MTSLQAVQQQFLQMVLSRKQDPGDTSFLRFPPSVSPRGVDARVKLVREMYWLRRVDALIATFPKTHAILGDETFRKLAARYVEAQPSHVPDLEDAGSAFPFFLRDAGSVGAWVVAAIEWAVSTSFRAADHDNATSVLDARVAHAPSAVAIDVPSAAAATVAAQWPDVGARLLIARRGTVVHVCGLSDAEWRAFDCSALAPSFVSLCETLAAEGGDENTVAATIVGLVHKGAVMFQAGLS
jgi:hypothetical protein